MEHRPPASSGSLFSHLRFLFPFLYSPSPTSPSTTARTASLLSFPPVLTHRRYYSKMGLSTRFLRIPRPEVGTHRLVRPLPDPETRSLTPPIIRPSFM